VPLRNRVTRGPRWRRAESATVAAISGPQHGARAGRISPFAQASRETRRCLYRPAPSVASPTNFKLGRNDSSWGFLVLNIRRFYLRKPSHRPVYILPNARREVSSGLRCPALRPFCLDSLAEDARLGTNVDASLGIVGCAPPPLSATESERSQLAPMLGPFLRSRGAADLQCGVLPRVQWAPDGRRADKGDCHPFCLNLCRYVLLPGT
jgi:hypothetical protein